MQQAKNKNNHTVSINNIYEHYSEHKKYIVTDIRYVSLFSDKYNELYAIMKLSTYLTLKIIPYIFKCIILYLPFLIFFITNKNAIFTIIAILFSILFDLFVMSYIDVVYKNIINKNSAFVPDKEFNKILLIQDEFEIYKATPYFIYKGKCII